MSTTYTIDKYTVYYSSNKFWPRIVLMEGENYVGVLKFIKPDGAALPQDSISDTGYITLYYPIDEFAHVIDLLRHEKPMHIWYYGTLPDNGIGTAREPVGEDET
jgi:hypothetical protein